MASDADLYRRGNKNPRTLLGGVCARDARGGSDAASGVTAAVFPAEPARSVYHNAQRPGAVAAMETAYAEAGAMRFAAWVYESETALRSALEQRGYRLDQTTRAMAIVLEDVRLPRPRVGLRSKRPL
jgi:hypothetical protein